MTTGISVQKHVTNMVVIFPCTCIGIIISESSSIITVLDNEENLPTTFDDGYDDVTQYDDEVKEMSANISSVSDTERGLLLTDSEYIDINYLTELYIIR